MRTFEVGERVDVEIAGIAIGEATISEITDDWVEFVYMGKTHRLPPDCLEYFDLFHLYS